MNAHTVNSKRDRSLLDFYIDHVCTSILPFWHKAVDFQHGGVFTCFSNDGSQLLSRDKYTWSQGRFLWLWSRIASMIEKQKLPGDADVYLSQAQKTVSFLIDHALMENGNCAFLLGEKGEKKESIPGQGYDTSFYADCFVVLGLTEFIRVTKRVSLFPTVLALYDRTMERLAAGSVRSEPYPIPVGFRSHSVSMIMLNVTQELAEVLAFYGHARAQEVMQMSIHYMHEIMHTFMTEEGRIIEILPKDTVNQDTLLYRHVNPGHAIECMWFVMHSAVRAEKSEVIQWAVKAIKWAWSAGWDQEYGGLFRFVDYIGGGPKGRLIEDPYVRLIRDTWDTKLWWPHSETLYTTLLGYALTQDEELLSIYRQTEAYVFKTFPNPNKEIGEWIQIRARDGLPINKVVALPVKDPYHILRNLLLIIELLNKKPNIMEAVK